MRFETVVDARVELPVTYAFALKSDASAPIPAVKLESVVDAKVLEPETTRFVRFRVPAVRAENAAFAPVIFPTVVEARVEDAEM